MRNVDKARETRLWIRDIIFPTVVVGAIVWNNPNARAWIKDKKQKIKDKFNRRKFKVIKGGAK